MTTDPAYALSEFSKIEQQLKVLDNPSDLKTLDSKLAAVQKLAQSENIALEQQNQLALYRIKTGKKIGTLLAASVGKGGRSASGRPGGSRAPLPDGITKFQSSRWQKLAKIPEELVTSYIDDTNQHHKTVTVAGLLRHARAISGSTGRRRPPRPKLHSENCSGHPPASSISELSLDDELLQEVPRVFDPELILGPSALKGKTDYPTLWGKKALTHEWPNSVLVLATENPGSWVDRMQDEVMHGSVERALGLFPAAVWEDWFQQLEGCRICITRRRTEQTLPFLLVYYGIKPEAFSIVYREAGLCLTSD